MIKVIKASAGSGKCVLGSTLIYNKNGLKTMKEVYLDNDLSKLTSYIKKEKGIGIPSHIHKIKNENTTYTKSYK